MSLRRFLNVAYNILVEEYQRIGIDLISAIEKLSEWSEGMSEPKQARPSQAVAAQNQASISALRGMLGNVQGAPGMRPPK